MYYLCCTVGVFVFKQKTAYELRISDWSSDVCSSDLGVHNDGGNRCGHRIDADVGQHRQGEVDEHHLHDDRRASHQLDEKGRATCRERVCQYVYVTVVGGTLTIKIKNTSTKLL